MCTRKWIAEMTRIWLLVVLVVWFGDVAVTHGGNCTQRVVLNDTWGVITDGPNNYTSHSHCEWLITAEPGKVINLVFDSMETECSYDHLFVYDGQSYDSVKLGAFSGDTLPHNLLATSGHMLIYFFSDWNYEMAGFSARYSVTDCPLNCTGHSGHCDAATRQCVCNSGYTGHACQTAVCPGNCNYNGHCNTTTQACVCYQGYAGYGCTLPTTHHTNDTHVNAGGWYHISPESPSFTPRTAHTGVFLEERNSLYVYGGNTLNGLLDDLSRYDFTENRWVTIEKSLPWPAPRYSHAMCALGGNIYVYGGILEDGGHSSEFWMYDVAANLWVDKTAESSVQPRAVASQSLTVVNEEYVYLFGGRTAEGEFLSDIYRTSLTGAVIQWKKVVPRGGKSSLRRLAGHSAVYHSASQSILVFGGFTPDSARFPQRTSALHAYHTGEDYWVQLLYDTDDFASSDFHQEPPVRAFHSAAIMGNYLVVYGGNAHTHNHIETCYDSGLYFYHLGCHVWVDRGKLEQAFNVSDSAQTVSHPGRFSAVAVAAFGNVLLISGGYRGNILGDLIAYKVPMSVAKNQDDPRYPGNTTHCSVHARYDNCGYDSECVWCDKQPVYGTPGCVARSQQHLCEVSTPADLSPGACRSVCSALVDCGACAVQGQGPVTRAEDTGLWYNSQCHWCVKEAQCWQRNEALQRTCTLANATESHMSGWWGGLSATITSLHQCTLHDKPAGLHMLAYTYPPDWNQPDQVELVRESSASIRFQARLKSKDFEYQGRDYTVKLRGFIHPLGVTPVEDILEIKLTASQVTSQFYLGLNDSRDSKELVAEISQRGSYETSQASRPSDNTSLFPHNQRGYKYYTEVIASHTISKVDNKIYDIKFDWTAALPLTQSRKRREAEQPLRYEFLEPYNHGACELYGNCLACMTDTDCGWCTLNGLCLSRAENSTSCVSPTPPGDSQAELIIGAEDCPVCYEKIGCHECLQDPVCEWSVVDTSCTRRGRFSDSVTNVTDCPAKCHQRVRCSECIGIKDECAWCESTHTCFPFVEYVVLYTYGGCGDWVDQSGRGVCHDCSRHANATHCLTDYLCGWCANDDNPTIGRCVDGDFQEASSSSNCTQLVSDKHNITEPASWYYSQLPDVEECRLGLDDCHVNATCINTYESYECECERGFTGDGRQTCDRTCYYECMHGTCSGGPAYECLCETGWTGPQCNTNCGCHNHSSCETGVGVCDACQHLTTGSVCQDCVAGAYGNATQELGCSECDCNGHADPDRGYCDLHTGECYCRDDTEGEHCELCVEGFYGEPRNGNKCYQKCEGRTIIANASSGSFGSREGSGVSDPSQIYCLWVITVYPNLESESASGGAVVPTITLTVEGDMQIACTQDHVYIYDGIPSVVQGSNENQIGDSSVLLASLCGDQPGEHTVVAQTGYLTVLLQANLTQARTVGFNASYVVNSCPNAGGCATPHHQCGLSGQCECGMSYTGPDCSIETCPEKCQPGLCDGGVLMQCECPFTHMGDECEYTIGPDNIAVQLLRDPYRIQGLGVYSAAIPRMGHSLMWCGDYMKFYLYGGYSLSHGLLGDMWTFEADKNQWTQMTYANANNVPSPRYLHAGVCEPVNKTVYLLGGVVAELQSSNQLWKYNTDTQTWTQIQIRGGLPSLAGHTLTYSPGSSRLLVIGGFSKTHYFTNETYMFSLLTQEWAVLATTGYPPIGIYGHSATLHTNSLGLESIYVYGGYEFEFDAVAPSSRLYVLSLAENRWSVLAPNADNQPEARMFHSAVTIGDHMLIYGGKSTHDDTQNSIMIYRLYCNTWMTAARYLVDVGNTSSVVKSFVFNMAVLDNASRIGHQVLIGSRLPPVVGSSAVAVDGEMYVVGGYDGENRGAVYRLILPPDLCHIYTDVATCLSEPGCSACHIPALNTTLCYSADGPEPSQCTAGPAATMHTAPSCDLYRLQLRECHTYETCHDCLATWPAHQAHANTCKWCRNCTQGKCIPVNGDCLVENPCDKPQVAVTLGEFCLGRACHAADCDTCQGQGDCVWTNQFKRIGEIVHQYTQNPLDRYNYNCVHQNVLQSASTLMSGLTICPTPCSAFTDCSACLQSPGAEGGAQECVWSSQENQCLPLHSLELLCLSGQCGHVLQGSPALCPRPCPDAAQCASCLARPHCGWCAVQGANGRGACVDGGLSGPGEGSCNATAGSNGVFEWSYMVCPLEDECLNNHSDCSEFQDCIDREHGFTCQCKTGYHMQDGSCVPVCDEGCVHGRCTSPGVCDCHFSYVGSNCSVACLCNGHSMCSGTSLEDRGNCTQCMNNTKGTQCESCAPLYVGDPQQGTTCRPCNQFCNQHSEICMTREHYVVAMESGTPLDRDSLLRWLEVGPRSVGDAKCVNCEDHSQGDNCSSCMVGYFRPLDELKSNPCRACECNGHNDRCHSTSGVCDECHNNTKSQSNCNPTTATQPQCWQVQCSECTEKYKGTPTNGHQCYLEMTIESDYCYDSSTQDKCCYDPYTQRECLKSPTVLPSGQAIFYAILPKYLNVDIRIILDVTQGAMDVYLSPFSDTWVITNDPVTWQQRIDIDPKYTPHIKSFSNTNTGGSERAKRDAFNRHFVYSTSIGGDTTIWTIPDEDLSLLKSMRHPRSNIHLHQKYRRDANNTIGTNQPSRLVDSPYDNQTIKLVDTSAEGMFSFKAIKYNETFLIVRNVENRLVISLPYTIHQLKVNQFYMILHGRGNAAGNDTYGSVFFRQDQPHIDLFVFFAVFFASFFMKLAIIVLIWKIKQSYDSQRSRQQRQEEMRHMARRPFSKVTVLFDPPAVFPPVVAEVLVQEFDSGGATAAAEHVPLLHASESHQIVSLGAEGYSDNQRKGSGDKARMSKSMLNAPGIPDCLELEDDPDGSSVVIRPSKNTIQYVKGKQGNNSSGTSRLQSSNTTVTNHQGNTTSATPSLLRGGKQTNSSVVATGTSSSSNQNTCNIVGSSGGSSSRSSVGGGTLERSRRSTLDRMRGRGNRHNTHHDVITNMSPVAIEPHEDGQSAVASVVFQLPGGCEVPVGVAFGSALVTTRALFGSLQRTGGGSRGGGGTQNIGPCVGSTTV